MGTVVAAEAKRLAAKIRSDFPTLLKLVWRSVGLPDPTPVQQDIATFLSDERYNRKIIQGFRGVAKTWTTAAFVVWCLRRDRHTRILVVSKSKSKADEISEFCQKIILSTPGLSDLIPQSREDSNWSRVRFTVRGAKSDVAASVTSHGVEGQITGCRADIIVADDIETPGNTATQEQREKLLRSVGEFGSILKEDSKYAQIIYLGTPHSADSLYNHLRERGYETRIWPAQIPEDLGLYHGCLGPLIHKMIENGAKPGDPVEPSRFSLEVLETKAIMDYGGTQTAGYRLQFMLDTSLSDLDKYPLKTCDLIAMSLDGERGPVAVAYANDPDRVIRDIPNVGFSGDRIVRPLSISSDWTPYESTVAFIDPSGRGKDETAIAVVSGLHGWLYVREVRGWKGGYEEATLIEIAHVCKRCGVDLCLIEPNYGGGMFTQLLRPMMGEISPGTTLVDDKHATVQKEQRICDVLEPVLGRHRLVIDERVIRDDVLKACGPKNGDGTMPLHYSLAYQLTHITRERGALKHDDRLDALAGAVEWWSTKLSRNTKEAEQSFKDAQAEQLIEEYLEWCDELDGRLTGTRSRRSNRGVGLNLAVRGF